MAAPRFLIGVYAFGVVRLYLSPKYFQPMQTNEAIGKVIRGIREKKTRLSQEALGDKAKLHRAHIWKIENGKESIQVNTLYQIAAALGVRPGDILNKADRLNRK